MPVSHTKPTETSTLNGAPGSELGDDAIPTGASRVRAVRGSSGRLLIPLAGAAMVAALSPDALQGAVLGLLAFGTASMLVPRGGQWAGLLPLMRSPLLALRPLIGLAILGLIQLATGAPALKPLEIVAVALGTTLAGIIPHLFVPRAWAPDRAIRIAVLGSTRTAIELARELRLDSVPEYSVAGRVEIEPDTSDRSTEMPTLGHMFQLADIIKEHDIGLLLFSSEVPRFDLFKEVSDHCLDLPVRLSELSGFYESVFGHVPVAEINPSWFQYIMHPNYRAVAPRSKRALDLVVATIVGVLSLPLLAVLALMIKRDGGPVLFRQERIGESGKPVTILKLRTMAVSEAGADPEWSGVKDPRVTPIGRFLRRTHIDEFPQLVNVIRGNMSLVGPRPEQPEFVERLEEMIPFYARRHLLKPGITGWAQVRCGYAGSDTGSAWKLSHDLYYLKHWSMGFDLAILGETVRTLVADRQHAVAPLSLSFVQSDPLVQVDRSYTAAQN